MSTPAPLVTPYLWVAQSRLYHTNCGIWCDQGQVMLVDPGIYPDEIESITALLEDQGTRARHLVLTHSHWDHILGPERFPGVSVIAHAAYCSEAEQWGSVIGREIASWEVQAGIEREQPFVIPKPDQTFEMSLDLSLGNVTLRLVHAPGHAADQIVVYHAAEGILWAADMLSDLEIPFVSHALSAYEQTLAMVSQWAIEVLVPGHGHPAHRAEAALRLAEDLAYLAELRGRVEQAVSQGWSMEETVGRCADVRYREPEANRGPHRLNVESAYAELGGEVGTDPVGWMRIMGE